MADERKTESSSSRKEAPAKTPLPERIAAVLGFMLVAAVVIYQTVKALEQDEGPPVLKLSIEQIYARQNRHLVRVDVHNEGGHTLATLTVTGRLLRNGQEVEKSQAQLDYAPAHAHRTVGLYFTHDPRELQLELVPEGYREP